MTDNVESWNEFRPPIYKYLYTFLDKRIESDPRGPDVSFLTSDGVQVNGHLAVLKSCPCLYLKNLFATNKDNYHLDVSSVALKAIFLFIYKGDLDQELDAETISEIISLTSPSKFDIPLMVEGYFKLLMTKREWYLIYSDAELGPVHLGILFDHLKAEQPKFYESSEFKNLSFDQVRRMCESTKRPFSARAEMTLALFQWATFNKAGDLLNQIKELVDMWVDPPPLILQNGVGDQVKTEHGSSTSTLASIQAQTGPQTREKSNNSADSEIPKENISIPVRKKFLIRAFNESNNTSSSTLPSIQAPTSPQSVQDHEESNNSADIKIPEENISPILRPVRKCRRNSLGMPDRTFFSRGSMRPESTPETGSGPGPSTVRQPGSGPTPKKPRKAGGSKSPINGGINDSPVDMTFDNAKILYFGKWEDCDALLSYSLKTTDIEKIAPIPLQGLRGMALVSARDKLYCLGGTVGTYVQDIVRSLPLETLGQPTVKWNHETKLIGDRCLFQAHYHLNSMYLFGGCDGDHTLNYINYYNFEDPKRKVWKYVKNTMEFSRESYGSAWLENQLILAGGVGLYNEITDGFTGALDSVEAFDPLSRDCKILPSMQKKRTDLQLLTLGGKVYAIGGIDESEDMLKSMEIYTPGNNGGEWVAGPSMNYRRAKGKAFVLDGKIYYAGGNSGWKPTLEAYDPVEEVWIMVESDIIEGADLSAAVIIPN